MPRGDGTGPMGQGRGMGGGRGMGRGGGQMRGGRLGAGSSGVCVCTGCGAKIPHTQGVPCTSIKCPKCGALLLRRS